mgnify:CR=1 FL=1
MEPTGANAMAISLARGERVALSRVDAFADGVAVKQVRCSTQKHCLCASARVHGVFSMEAMGLVKPRAVGMPHFIPVAYSCLSADRITPVL